MGVVQRFFEATVDVCLWSEGKFTMETHHIGQDYVPCNVVDGVIPLLLCYSDAHVSSLRLDAWMTEVKRLPKLGETAFPCAALDGTVHICQISSELNRPEYRYLFCDEQLVYEGSIVMEAELVA